MNLDRVALDLCIKGIEFFFQLRLGQELAGAGKKGFKQGPFARRQLHRLAIAANAARRQIDTQ